MDKDSKGAIEKELDEISFRSYAVYIEGKLLVHGLDLNKPAPICLWSL